MATTPAKVTVAALIEKTEEDKLEAPAAEEEEQVAAPVEAEKEVWDKEGEEGEGEEAEGKDTEKSEDVKKELEVRIIDPDDIVEITITVDPKHHRYFTGRQGEVLRKIGEEFGGVVISFSRKGVVFLKGTKNYIEGAVAKIKEIAQDLEEQVTIDCDIEQQFHRTIMGVKVEKIKAEFNVQIKFPGKALKNGANPNNIQITGKKSNCEAANKALSKLVPITVEVSVPNEFHR